jgi:transcriptional regulator with XRE-family HTH domain
MRAGLKQGEAARKVGLSQGQLSRYESGVASPTLKTLGRLLDAYGADLGQLAAAAREFTSPNIAELGSAGLSYELIAARLIDRCRDNFRFDAEASVLAALTTYFSAAHEAEGDPLRTSLAEANQTFDDLRSVCLASESSETHEAEGDPLRASLAEANQAFDDLRSVCLAFESSETHEAEGDPLRTRLAEFEHRETYKDENNPLCTWLAKSNQAFNDLRYAYLAAERSETHEAEGDPLRTWLVESNRASDDLRLACLAFERSETHQAESDPLRTWLAEFNQSFDDLLKRPEIHQAEGDPLRTWLTKSNQAFDDLRRAYLTERPAQTHQAIVDDLRRAWLAAKRSAETLLGQGDATLGQGDATLGQGDAMHVSGKGKEALLEFFEEEMMGESAKSRRETFGEFSRAGREAS